MRPGPLRTALALAAGLLPLVAGVPARGALVEVAFAPKEADPAITRAFEDHYAVLDTDRAGSRTGELFVFLPGTGGSPRFYRLIVQEAARQGHLSLGLSYPNEVAVGDLCAGSPDAECHGKVRQEILEGRDTSPLVEIARADSIEVRLVKALAVLDARFPSVGWGRFVADGHPAWDRIRFAGHSQGGGHAAYIAKDRAVAGVACFSSPADWDAVRHRPAAWLSAGHATPTERYWAFSHLRDELVPWPVVTAAWQALGLPSLGGPVSVDSAAPPYGGSRQLSTDRPLVAFPGATFHGETVVDVHTPKNPDGTPVYGPAWRTACCTPRALAVPDAAPAGSDPLVRREGR